MQTFCPCWSDFPFTAVWVKVCKNLWLVVKTAQKLCTKNGIGGGQITLWTRPPKTCIVMGHCIIRAGLNYTGSSSDVAGLTFSSFFLCPACSDYKCRSIEVRFCRGSCYHGIQNVQLVGKPRCIFECVGVPLWVCGRTTFGLEVKRQSSKRAEVRSVIDKQVIVVYVASGRAGKLPTHKKGRKKKTDRLKPNQCGWILLNCSQCVNVAPS